MYERFTDQARRVIALANQMAQEKEHDYIGTGHLLVGLVEEGSGVGIQVLKNSNIDLKKVGEEINKLIESDPQAEIVVDQDWSKWISRWFKSRQKQEVGSKLPPNPLVKKVLEYAIEEARALGHNYVGTEHLLLGLVRGQQGIGFWVLMRMGVRLEKVREEVLGLLEPGTSSTRESQTGDMFKRFTDRVRKVMVLANQVAQRLNHEYIGTEHILLGLVKEGTGVGVNVLKNLEVDLGKMLSETEKLTRTPPGIKTAYKLPQTPSAKKVIEYAIEEARTLDHKYVGTEHLLLGLIREPVGIAGQVLRNLGLELEQVREEVKRLLG